MKAIYFDAFSGVSGDMFLGALLDLGVAIGSVQEGLARLPVQGYHLHAARRTKQGISGTKFDVHLGQDHGHALSADGGPALAVRMAPADDPAPTVAGLGLHEHSHEHPHEHSHEHPHEHSHEHSHEHPHEHSHEHSHEHGHRDHDPSGPRDFGTIRALIDGSSLSPWVRERAVRVFRRIAEAEGKIHGVSPEAVHFHEVGSLDSIVDIVGGCIAVEALGCPRVFASPLVDGRGWVRCAHGRFPVPTPATLEILAARGLSLSQCEEPQEMVTPTGAALLAELAESFGPLPPMRLERVGYGLGTRDMTTRPNVLRTVLGDLTSNAGPGASTSGHDWETDQIARLETNLDDAHPEVLGHFLERGLAAGALDVFYAPVQMKKSRPGVVLTVLCPVEEADRFAAMILTETSAFGVRRSVVERRKLRREWQVVETPWGGVTVKLGRLDGRLVQVAPEYESCREVAAAAGVGVKSVYEAAVRAFPAPSPRAP